MTAHKDKILALLLAITAAACSEDADQSPLSISVSEVRLGMSVTDVEKVIKSKYSNVFQGYYPVFRDTSQYIKSLDEHIGQDVYLIAASFGTISGIPFGTPSSDFEILSVLFSSSSPPDQKVVAVYKMKGYSSGLNLEEANAVFRDKYPAEPTQFISRFGAYLSYCYAWSKDGDLLKYNDQVVTSPSYTKLDKECNHLYSTISVPDDEDRYSTTQFNLASQPPEATVIFFTQITNHTIATSLIDGEWAERDERFRVAPSAEAATPEF